VVTVLLAVMAVLLVVLAVALLPRIFVPDTAVPDPVELVKARNDVRGSLLSAIGGLGALVALYFTWMQVGLSRRQADQTAMNFAEQQTNERLAKSAEMLGHAATSVQVAGISNLEVLARERPDKCDIIAQVLVSFVRQSVPLRPEGPAVGQYLATRCPAAEWALVALGRTVVTGRWPKRLRLNMLDLTGANLEALSFTGADFARSCLDEAFLLDTNLRNAWMPHVSFREADFREAHVAGAVVNGADLSQARNLDAESLAALRGDDGTQWPTRP
jgi:hypothetical protein